MDLARGPSPKNSMPKAEPQRAAPAERMHESAQKVRGGEERAIGRQDARRRGMQARESRLARVCWRVVMTLGARAHAGAGSSAGGSARLFRCYHARPSRDREEDSAPIVRDRVGISARPSQVVGERSRHARPSAQACACPELALQRVLYLWPNTPPATCDSRLGPDGTRRVSSAMDSVSGVTRAGCAREATDAYCGVDPAWPLALSDGLTAGRQAGTHASEGGMEVGALTTAPGWLSAPRIRTVAGTREDGALQGGADAEPLQARSSRHAGW